MIHTTKRILTAKIGPSTPPLAKAKPSGVDPAVAKVALGVLPPPTPEQVRAAHTAKHGAWSTSEPIDPIDFINAASAASLAAMQAE